MPEEEQPAHDGRIVSIDLLRGFAIAWVVLFHIWGDIEFFPGKPKDYYDQLTWQVEQGRGPWAIFTSATDLFFRDGFQGVPLFMMISGLSLTIAAYRAGDSMRWLRFFGARLRRLLVPYWAGVALTYGVILLIAWRQVAVDGGAFADHFGSGITISKLTPVLIDRDVVIASVTLVPRLTGGTFNEYGWPAFDGQWFFAPQLALWFVGLLAQYYLLFPLLFVVMRRIGVAAFLALTFAFTVGANAWAVREYAALELKFPMVTGLAPFRLFEFTAGMALGWLLVAPEARRTLTYVRQPAVIVAAVAIGFVAHTAGDLMIGTWTADDVVSRDASLYRQAVALPLVTLGLALLALPLLVKPPSRIDLSVPLRAFATIGVMSYAILIVSDAMRLVASQIRVEEPPGAVWWTFLVAVYVPVSVLIAWPLARLLGLMPARRRRRPASPAPLGEPPETAPVGVEATA